MRGSSLQVLGGGDRLVAFGPILGFVAGGSAGEGDRASWPDAPSAVFMDASEGVGLMPLLGEGETSPRLPPLFSGPLFLWEDGPKCNGCFL